MHKGKKIIKRLLTPCFILSITLLCIIFYSILNSKSTNDWGLLAAAGFVPLVLIFLVLDIVTKKIIKNNLLKLWLFQIILVAIVIIGFQILIRY